MSATKEASGCGIWMIAIALCILLPPVGIFLVIVLVIVELLK